VTGIGERRGEPVGPHLYKITDAVRVLRMSRSIIYEQIKAGRIRTVKQGRATFITAAALADYIALLEQEAKAA
jgi:Helix-turn-helix domain